MTDERQRLRQWFDRESEHPRPSVLQALSSLKLEDGDRVADIGCGPGVHLRQILKHVAPGGEVLGIDTNTERLSVAEQKLQDEIQRGSISLIEGDLHNLDTGVGAFDLIWMSLVLHHEEVPAEVIGNLASYLRPGGRIAVLDGDDLASFPFLPWPPRLEVALRQAIVRSAEAAAESGGFTQRFTGRNLPGILSGAGLVDVHIDAFTDIRQAPLDDWDREDIQDWLINSFGRRIRDYLPPADWKEFEQLIGPEASHSILEDPGFFMTRTWFLGTGSLN